jgi:putative MATE family efflux protein
MTAQVVESDRPNTATMSARTREIVEAPILTTLLRLAAPNLLFIVSQAVVSIGETYFIGWLGADALAAVSLVFPVLMVMQTTSGGGIGSGVASAISRALGGRRAADADALVVASLAIAAAFGIAFSIGVVLGGRALFSLMGGVGTALDQADTYATILFAGALVFWIFNTLGSILRGAGIMSLPAMTSLVGAVMTLTVSPALILGIGPVPRLGISGAALAIVAYYTVGAIILGTFLLSGRAPVRVVLASRLEWRHFHDVLRVGVPGALNAVVFNSAILFFTALVGPFGTTAIAGYGVGARLEYLQIPIVFGLGMALITMVGTNVGAGLEKRAKQVAWSGAVIAGAITGAIGIFVAVAPRLWVGIFSTDAEIYASGSRYLMIVGPFYCLYGAGLALYFAAQGAGKPMWPLILGCGRVLVTVLGGLLAVHSLGGGLEAIYAMMAAGLVLFGIGSALSVYFVSWR